MQENTANEATSTHQPANKRDPRRVLLVDDEPLLLASYRRMLRSFVDQHGETVHLEIANGPLAGLEALERQPADVVVADYRMPEMNGDEFLERVQNRWPNTVRILATAYTDVQMIEEVVRRARIFRFLKKPCSREKFCQSVGDGLAHSDELRENRRSIERIELDLHSYRHLFESALDPMMVADLQGTIAEANDAFLRLCDIDGTDKSHPRRKTLVEGPPYSDSWEHISQTLRECGHWSGEIKRGHYVGLLSISGIVDDSGKTYAYAAVEKDVSARYRLEEQARAAQYEVILALAKLAEYRDPETGAHLERMRRYSRILARRLAQNPKYAEKIDNAYVEAIFYSSPLHDIGKVGIPDSVLLKPGKLSGEEWKVMQRHTLIGAEVLSAAGETLSEKSWLSFAQTIAIQHHEKFDGSGYPHGLKGDDIDFSARIVALADAYDAITSKRVYKDAMSHRIARERIMESANTHFDPDVVEAFLHSEDEFLTVKKHFDAQGDTPADQAKRASVIYR